MIPVAVDMRAQDELALIIEYYRVRDLPLDILAPPAAIWGARAIPAAILSDTLHKDKPLGAA